MIEPRHFVIAGGTGLIGRALAAHWLSLGARVSILTRRLNADLPVGVEAVHWDGEQAGPWQAVIDGADGIVNLCGESIGDGRWTVTRKQRLLDSRVKPTRALVAAVQAAQRPPQVFIQASGVGIYGTGDASMTEASPAGTDYLARLAIDWEAAAAPVADRTRLTVARLGVVLDGEAGAFPKLALPFRLGVGGPIAGGRQWLSWIHRTDVVAALAFLAESSDLSGAVNCTAPEPLRNGDAARILGRLLHRPAFLPTPRIALELALGEMATLVCDGQRALPARLREAGFTFRYPTFEAAAASLLDT